MDVFRVELKNLLDYEVDGQRANPLSREMSTLDLRNSMKQRLDEKLDPLITPLVVMQADEDDKYYLISGYRRRAALRALRQKSARCTLYEGPKPLFLMAASNIQQPYSPLEAANQAQLMRSVRVNGQRLYTEEEIRNALGVTTHRLRLLADLLRADHEVKQAVDSGKLSFSAFKAISKESPGRQREILSGAKERIKNEEGKVSTDVVRKARRALQEEENGKPAVGDPDSLRKELLALREQVARLRARSLSESERMAAHHHVAELEAEVQAWAAELKEAK